MSIKNRLALLVGLLLLAFLAVLRLWQHGEQAHAEQARTVALQNSAQHLQQWLDLTNQPLLRFGQDYSAWNELADYLRHPTEAWAETNLRQPLAHYQAHALWLFDAEGRLVYSAHRTAGPPLPPPLTPEIFSRLRREAPPFYAESRDGLLQVWPYAVSAGDPTPAGWLLIARLWDDSYLRTLSQLSEHALQLSPANVPLPSADPGQRLLPLAGLDGTILRHLRVHAPLPASITLPADATSGRLFIAFGLLLLVAVWLGLRQWVVQPLKLITETLRQENPTLITPLLAQQNEFGRFAQLIQTSFAQKNTLVREIEERTRMQDALRISQARLQHAVDLRARLARDLHDGVIQSIYAAGLGLESALAQWEHEPAAARQRFLFCRQSLNEIIREVRSFIDGLEPDRALPQSFSQALDALIHTMQALGTATISPIVDDAAARQLTPAQEVHLLQITRECISNAVRHGEARHLDIALRGHAGQALLEIRDDGHGFDPRDQTSSGHGLHNITTRAREMNGEARIVSTPGAGTTVTVRFPLQPLVV